MAWRLARALLVECGCEAWRLALEVLQRLAWLPKKATPAAVWMLRCQIRLAGRRVRSIHRLLDDAGGFLKGQYVNEPEQDGETAPVVRCADWWK